MKISKKKKILLIILIILVLCITSLIIYKKLNVKKYILTEYVNSPVIKKWENFEMFVGKNGITFFLNHDELDDIFDLYIYDKDGKDITPREIRKNEKDFYYGYNILREYSSAENKTDGFKGIEIISVLNKTYINLEGKIIRYEPKEVIFEKYQKANNKKYKKCAKKQKGDVVSSNSNVAMIVFDSYYRGTEYDAMYYLYDENCNSINEYPYDIYPFFINDNFIVSGYYNEEVDKYNTYINYDAEIRDGNGNLIELDGIKNGENLIYLGNDGENIIFFLQDGIVYKLEAV